MDKKPEETTKRLLSSKCSIEVRTSSLHQKTTDPNHQSSPEGLAAGTPIGYTKPGARRVNKGPTKLAQGLQGDHEDSDSIEDL